MLIGWKPHTLDKELRVREQQALPPHSAQATAIAPHSMACSSVRSISDTTEKSHRSWAGMRRNYTPFT